MPSALDRENTLWKILACLVLALYATGCAYSPQFAASKSVLTGPALRGHVHGGQQPISGSTIQLYTASTSDNAGLAAPLLSTPVKTTASGNFSITGAYTCPDAASLVYLVATDGNPGLAAGTSNKAIALMTALGPCGALTPATFIAINEVTTVASVASLAPYMTSYANMGANSADLQQLASAFTTVTQLVDTASGTIPGPAMPTGYSAPTQTINTLANILAACINSTGGTPDDGSACTKLFADIAPSVGKAPADTIAALLQIFKNPAINLPAVFSFATPNSPFQPTLASIPSNLSLAIQPLTPLNLPQRSSLLGEYLLNEGSGTEATDSSGLGNHGTIVGPAWEGKYGLNFNAIGQYIQLPTALNQVNTWMFALYSPPFGYATYPQPPGYGKPANFGTNPSILCGNTQQHTCVVASSYFKPLSQRFLAFASDSTEAANPLPAGWHIVMLVGGQNGDPDHEYYDGIEVQYTHQGSGMFAHPSTGNYQIGGSNLYINCWYVGKIAAAWAWSTSLPTSDAPAAYRSALDFLHVKGAAPTYAPNIHHTPLIIGGIDSRTEGTGVSSPWIDQLNLTDQSYTTLNLGFYAATAYDHAAMFDTLHAPQIVANTAPTIEIFWGGVNDFNATKMSIRGVADSLKALTQKSKALGARVIMATEISSNYSPSGDSGKNALNAIIRAEAFTWGADNLADLATIPQLGADGAYASSLYFYDRLHPTDLAETLITAAMSNAVNELLGSTPSSHHVTSAVSYPQLAGDRYLDLTGLTSQMIALPSCTGYSLSRSITNLGQNPSTVIPSNNEDLQGSKVVLSGATGIFVPTPGPLSAGGCSWSRNQ